MFTTNSQNPGVFPMKSLNPNSKQAKRNKTKRTNQPEGASMSIENSSDDNPPVYEEGELLNSIARVKTNNDDIAELLRRTKATLEQAIVDANSENNEACKQKIEDAIEKLKIVEKAQDETLKNFRGGFPHGRSLKKRRPKKGKRRRSQKKGHSLRNGSTRSTSKR